MLSKNIEPTYSFNENETPSFSIILAGEPTPVVSWKFGDEESKEGLSQQVNEEAAKQKEYSFSLNSLQASDCGKSISYKATGYSETIIEKSAKVWVKCAFLSNL